MPDPQRVMDQVNWIQHSQGQHRTTPFVSIKEIKMGDE